MLLLVFCFVNSLQASAFRLEIQFVWNVTRCRCASFAETNRGGLFLSLSIILKIISPRQSSAGMGGSPEAEAEVWDWQAPKN